MSAWEAVLLGVVQGLTEFLPVSSSAHLAIAQWLIPGFSQPGLVFDVALHCGTVAAVLALEWRRVVEAWRGGYAVRLGAQLAVATLATVAVALPLRGFAEAAFQSPPAVASGLVATGLLLVVGAGVAGRREAADAGWGMVVFVGLAQGAAAMPGISRSGATIVAGTVAGMERRWAADFSFLLSVPAIVGAMLVQLWSYRADLGTLGPRFAALSAVGALSAAVVGAVALVAVKRLVRSGRLHLFAMYVLPVAVLVWLGWARGWLP